MNIRQALSCGVDHLKENQITGASVDVLVFLCAVLHVGTAYLYAHGDRELTPDERAAFDAMIRLGGTGMPSAYVIGSKEFMSLTFKVNGNVLIPRPETELLAETVIRKLNGRGGAAILDIGTGSGCIAVSLAHYLPDCRVAAVDISRRALEVAAGNALAIGVGNRVDFICADVFKGLDELDGLKFDAVVSNPPYVASHEMTALDKSVSGFEPAAALEGGASGLEFYPAIRAAALRFLKPGGFIALEIGYGQSAGISELFAEPPGALTLMNDYSGIARFAFIDL